MACIAVFLLSVIGVIERTILQLEFLSFHGFKLGLLWMPLDILIGKIGIDLKNWHRFGQ